jgi:hypothetical protein
MCSTIICLLFAFFAVLNIVQSTILTNGYYLPNIIFDSEIPLAQNFTFTEFKYSMSMIQSMTTDG